MGASTSQKNFRSNLTAVDYRYKVRIVATNNFEVGFWQTGVPGTAVRAISLTSRFSGVLIRPPTTKTVLTVCQHTDSVLSVVLARAKTVKTVLGHCRSAITPLKRGVNEKFRTLRRGDPLFTTLLVLLCFTLATSAPAGSATAERTAARAEHAFFEAQARFNKAGNDPEAAWQFALACFDWADLAPSNARRAEIAEQGIAASRRAIERDSRSGAAHYYLALNLGQLARTKKLAALKLVDEMETEFKEAIGFDPKVDYAGPDRSLGLLYLDAPGWPTSIGSRAKARLHLRTAVELCPDYPENLLCLLEAYLKWGDKSTAQSQLASTEDALQRSRKSLTGEKWESSWQDWEHRWEKIKAKAAEPPSSLESPKHRK